MHRLALLVLVACGAAAPPPSAPRTAAPAPGAPAAPGEPAAAAATTGAPEPTAAPAAPSAVLRWSSHGDAIGLDSIVRHRLHAAHLDEAGALFRGTTLEVSVPDATPERQALVRQLVEKPLDVHFAAASGATFALDRTSLTSASAAVDRATNRPQIEILVADAAGFAEFSSHGPLSLVIDGDVVLDHIVRESAIERGRLVITMRDDRQMQQIADALRAAKAGPIAYEP
ncbi:MAG TPA: hypothetical protein VLX92_04585 [Kofleriaceae bacterium]|nr:hypothetical protein [Kofleriaceae bacterium]